MGRATRWLKNLFGIRRDKEQQHKQENSNYGDPRSMKFSSSSSTTSAAQRNSSNSRVLCHNPATIPPNISPAEAAWLQSFYNETEKEQNKHAIAVAAATAAAADAAVAAAQAAVAVVRLTSHGRGTMLGAGHEICAATKIQTVFRGYLARKALRALKGLVKLQALVRGYLVRKQATATLHGMQALIRAQATVRSQKKSQGFMAGKNDSYRSQIRARRSMERFDDTRSEYTAPTHSRRLSSSFDATINNNNSFDGSPKIVEVDTGIRPKSRSRRTNTSMSDFGDDPSFQTISSPLPIPCRTPGRLSIPDHSDWGLTGEECRFSTAQSTPRFATSTCSCGSVAATTPKSVCNESFFYGNYPNYMVSTQSFKAKLRSHSAPKQRPEPGGARKRLTLNEMMESRNSLSGVKMQRSCSQIQEAINFKNAVMGRLHTRDADRNHFQKRRW
ncbi:hypothetical protein HN51_008561 [Arachis hypogaea]|uniref:DUF4005 domain-containing protein n=2 Tax=Arachis TaxID=3817 RepID=A0A445D372_ARAHY|nr:protein IQ-domain 26 [Arachis duranensis]XP_025700863.1 protein IQ-DOMAIN 14 [Arachis hypogaea]QHO42884.1 Protein IQ-DOMAIN [Arachis hypogaea]RYR57591.1 hypothetical protein Ahy_A05g023293 [Arachis hypogaea]